MMKVCARSAFAACLFLLCAVVTELASVAQQTLGSLNGTVTDISGAVIAKATVVLTNAQTGAVRQVATGGNGAYAVQDLPAGVYRIEISGTGFENEVFEAIRVQADRTVTVNGQLHPGSANETVQVSATPLLNTVDTTNGYVLDSSQISSLPLGTGSFTQLATLSPGVSADFLADTGTNTGLGNQNIWANGQRLSSNTFTFDGVLANNLFNGASSSQVGANRAVLNTGESFQNGGTIKTNTSIYDAIGEALPTPPQESIGEMQVNTSMYDVSQGDTAGAHIDVSTKSGTNDLHGSVFGTFGDGKLNADPFFFKQSGLPTPDLHRYDIGASLGGPVVKSRVFYYGAYQWTRVRDQLNSFDQYSVPLHLTDDRSPSGLANVVTQDAGLPAGTTIDPVALHFLQAKLPDGSYLIRSPTTTANGSYHDVDYVGPASKFQANRALLDVDYNLTKTDTLTAKYYFQHDPTESPFNGSLEGFPQQFNSGSQVFALENTHIFNPRLSWEQKGGFLRMTVTSFTGQPFGPSAAGINLFGSAHLPGIYANDFDGNGNSLPIGPTSNFSNTGFVQNTWEGTSNLNWQTGSHTLSFGANYDFTQLNILNRADQVAALSVSSLGDLLEGHPLRTGVENTVYFQGASNRYYRAPQIGAYAQDKWRLNSKLTVSLGLRFDNDGGLYEKYGRLVNFDPSKYQYDLTTDTIMNSGLVIAGNNPQYKTPGASNSTLTQRQWGFGPRVGLAWSPTSKLVWRTGFGIYYDRGEYFTEFSPSAGNGFNGPFGVTLQPPFVQPVLGTSSSTLENPFGTTLPTVDTNPEDFINNLPNQGALMGGANPYLFGAYGINNKLPYTEDWSLDLQWQVRPDIMATVGYTGNHDVRQTIPVPFNQPQIATTAKPVNGQSYSYGWQATDSNYNPLLTEPNNTYDGGNTDLRVPYIGYNPNSVAWTTRGIGSYDALMASARKTFGQGLDFLVSYTWSHALDESSDYGLFYNGNNPQDLRSGYASADFDRTNVTAISYDYFLPTMKSGNRLVKGIANGWGMSGIATLESGQPYNVYDFSGTVGSLFFSSNDYLTNPVLPLAPGVKPRQALTGHSGAFPPNAAFTPEAFAYPLVAPGQDGVPPCGPTTAGTTVCDSYESTFSYGGRNIFRGAFQKRADISLIKLTKLGESRELRLSADFFNITNTPSFDTPGNNFNGDPNYSPYSSFDSNGNPNGFAPLSGSAFSSQGVGTITNPLGSPRQIQFAGRIQF
jgi:hypothetical protein